MIIIEEKNEAHLSRAVIDLYIPMRKVTHTNNTYQHIIDRTNQFYRIGEAVEFFFEEKHRFKDVMVLKSGSMYELKDATDVV